VPAPWADKTVPVSRARGEKGRNGTGKGWCLEVPLSGGNNPRARKKWRPRVTSSLGRMHRGSPRGKETALSSFLQSEYTANVWKHSKTDTENEDQMSGKVSNESPGRIDTR